MKHGIKERFYAKRSIGRSNKGKLVSYEIECYFPDENSLDSFIIDLETEKLGKSVSLSNDGSIEWDFDEYPLGKGLEVKVTCVYGQWAPLKDVCKLLQQNGAMVNSSCGLHVHFDCRNKTISQADVLADRVARAVPALKKILPESRRDNSYCLEDRNSIDDYDSRFAFVNSQAYHKYQTIEIRGHSGTISATKIINWTMIIKHLMRLRDTSPIATVDELLTKVKFGRNVASYIKHRAEVFSHVA